MIGLNAGTAYLRIRPDLRDFHKIVKRELSDLDKTVDVKTDTRKAVADLTKVSAQADKLAAKSPTVNVKADTAKANTGLARTALAADRLDGKRAAINVTADTSRANASIVSTALAAERLDGKNVEIDVKTKGGQQAASFLGQTSLTMGQMAVAAGALGAAMIPLAAGVAAVGAALSAPLAAAGGGLTIFGIIAGVAIKRTKEQIKEIDDLREKIGEAEGLKERAAATRAYRQALDQLSPAQKRFMNAENRMSSAFDRLMTAAGPAIFGPLVTGMNLLSRIMPKLAPVLGVVAGALTNVLRSVGQAVSGGAFTSFLDFFQRYAGPAIESFAKILGNVVAGVFGFIQAFAPMGTSLLGGIERLSGGFARFGQTVGSSSGFRGFMDYVKQIGPTVVEFFRNLWQVGVNLVQALAPIGGVILRGLSAVFGILSKIPIDVLTAGITALATAFVLWKVASLGVSVALWAISATPVTLIIAGIVAGVALLAGGMVLLWKRSETFRKIVTAVWASVKRGVSVAWNNVIKPVFRALSGFITGTLMPAFRRLWNNVVKPVFGAIGRAIGWAWKNVVKPVFRAWWWYIRNILIPVIRFIWNNVVRPVFKALGKFIAWTWNNVIRPALRGIWWFIRNVLVPVIRWLWNNVVRPVFKALGKFIAWTWSNVIRPALRLLWAYIRNVLVPVIRWLWNNVVKPVFKLIGGAIKSTWNNVIKPALRALWAFIKNVVVPVIRWLWNNVVKPVFKGIGNTISTVWNKGIKPVFQALGGFIRDTLVPAFRKGIDKIGEIWNSLKRLAAKPVNFVIDTIYNKGIRSFVNKVLDFFDIGEKSGPRLPKVKTINWGGKAQGGVLPGYTPGRDVHRFVSPTGGRLDLSGGEAVMRPEWTKAVGGPSAVARMNDAARLGMSFFRGGVMPTRAERVSMHGSPGSYYGATAWDINGPGEDKGQPVRAWKQGRVASVKRQTTSYGKHVRINHPGSNQQTLYAHLMAIAVRAGQRVREGQRIGRLGGSGNASGPHLHFEVDGGLGAVRDSARDVRQYRLRRNASGYGGVKPHVAAVGDLATRLFGPFAGGIGGVGQRSGVSDHPSGHALDFMTMRNRDQGDKLAKWLSDEHRQMALKYIIWRQRIKSPAGSGWDRMGDRGDPTSNHMDHVHASFLKSPHSSFGKKVISAVGGGGGGGSNVPSWLAAIPGRIQDLIGKVGRLGDTGFGGMMGKVASALIDRAQAFAADKIASLASSLGISSAKNYGPGADGIWRSLMSTGFYSPKQAAGVMGNMVTESGLVHNIVQGGGRKALPTGVSSGWGLVQWTPGTKVLPYLNGDGSVGSQVGALTAQLRGKGSAPEGAAGRKLRATNSVGGATYAFGKHYERPADLGSTIAKRRSDAMGLYQRFAGKARDLGRAADPRTNPTLSDNGGWLHPLQTTTNKTRKPEPVFSNSQWQILKKAITAATMNQGRPINASWLRSLTRDVPKSADVLRREFLKLRDALRPVRIRTERARRRLKRLRSSERFKRRDEERDEAVKAFEATRSGEEIGEEVAETRRTARRSLRRARRSPIGRDALRDYRKASRELEKQRDIEVVEAAERRTKWRRQEARERLKNERAGISQARDALKKAQEQQERAETKAEKQRARERVKAAEAELRRARRQPDSAREKQARAELKRTARRLKKLGEERSEIDKLTKARDKAGQQSDAVKELADARKKPRGSARGT